MPANVFTITTGYDKIECHHYTLVKCITIDAVSDGIRVKLAQAPDKRKYSIYA